MQYHIRRRWKQRHNYAWTFRCRMMRDVIQVINKQITFTCLRLGFLIIIYPAVPIKLINLPHCVWYIECITVSRDTRSHTRNASALHWRHNDHDGVSSHQPHGCLLNRLFERRSKKTSKLRVTGLCAGNSPGTCEFPAQMASYAENASIWWQHHDTRNASDWRSPPHKMRQNHCQS